MDIQELTLSYQARTKAHFKLVSEFTKGKNKNSPSDLVPPDYIKEVIIPVHQLLADKFPKGRIEIPDENYALHQGYFQVKMNKVVVGGLSYPIANEAKIYFTPLCHKQVVGKRQEITSIEQLHQIISRLLDKRQKQKMDK
ncbi:hypothetical protein [Bacteroides sp.]|uniref:hypothetical protein n=1 Tax=Bacteroides sp. TaxID=29523 RepID=UPI002A7FDDA8|nr:hypothetical protein [Bacteroides sp.]